MDGEIYDTGSIGYQRLLPLTNDSKDKIKKTRWSDSFVHMILGLGLASIEERA